MTFRPGESDANNRTRAHTAGVYLQDQVALTPYLQLVAGARFERFDLTFNNFRNGRRSTGPTTSSRPARARW